MWLKIFAHRRLGLPYRLHIRQYGKSGPRIVFLHGIGSSNKIWLPIIKQLQGHCRCIVVDLLGHGSSPKPTVINYTVDDHARSLAWSLFWSGYWGKSIFVGFSMGNIIGVRLMVKHPRLARGFVSIAMPIYLRRNNLDQPRRLEGYLDAVYLNIYQNMRKMPRDPALKSAQAIVKKFPIVFGQIRLQEEDWYPLVSSLANTIENQDLINDLKKLPEDLPIEIIYGLRDNLVIANNLKNSFKSRPMTRITRVNAPHEITQVVVAKTISAIQQLNRAQKD